MSITTKHGKPRASVESFKSESSGRAVANQFRIFTEHGTFFQSYSTVIAYKPFSGPIQLDHDSWDYSRTTAKYRNQFLRETTKETERKIENGEYVLTDLNR